MENYEHEYYEDIPPEELYGDEHPPEDYPLVDSVQKSFVPKADEEKYEEKETVLTMPQIS